MQASGSERQTHAIVLSQNEVDKCETETECAQRNCGKGRCKALEVATCDCFGTSKSGPNCANGENDKFVHNGQQNPKRSN